ncbi:MHYT domain-containing protein [Nocardia sp. alder85J]|uniref:MHYT domain-containing protein n=1 Tax=Nocardia sp. alder85J TaxID=2862949 RepID=UPI001CD75914|nr:MHYT domain-containing protein [Nocardia sp. alder85J]MCX4097075.1 hypothetical protein [Nocardia sp. alder85J]
MAYFTMGYWVLGLAMVVSLAGVLVGFACVRQSTMSITTHFRLVWLVAASVSIGGVGVWLAVFVNMLGVAPPDGTARYDLLRTVGGAVLAIASILAGLLLAGRQPRTGKLMLAAVVSGLGLGLTHLLAVAAIRVQGSIDVAAGASIGVLIVAIVIAAAMLWAPLGLRSAGLLTATAAAIALAVTGMHYLGLIGLALHADKAALPPSGEDLFTLFVPVFVLGTLSLAVPITAVLVSPDRTGRMVRSRATAARSRGTEQARTPSPIG